MTFWDRVGDPFRYLVEGVATLFRGDHPSREGLIFTAAIIALSAKMAKADGVVTADEVSAFRRICEVPEGQESQVRRLFDLAKRSVTGFDGYARQVRALYQEHPEALEDVLDGLFSIATADGAVHERELAYLEHVAEIFGLDQARFARLRARHVRAGEADPYLVLGIEASESDAAIKRHYRRLVAENHPDQLMSHGLPPEFLKLANDRLAAFNAAYDQIARERGM
jgi:DnaJ like chaperone protein